MLRSVFEDYLKHITRERAFDAPLLALLSSMGFFDIHFTHSQVEFGKDFIAKITVKNRTIQYSFQSKCGDINQATWRNDILGQMREAIYSSLSHPNFDAKSPHQSVLVTTGRLLGNTALAIQNFNDTISKTKSRLRPIEVWDQLKLIDLLQEYGGEGVHHANSSEFIGLGHFYIQYGKSQEGKLIDREIEDYSREWIRDDSNHRHILLLATIQSDVISAKCREQGQLYEAIHFFLGLLRAILYFLYIELDQSRIQWLNELRLQSLALLENATRNYVLAMQQTFFDNENTLMYVIPGLERIATYPIHCSRLIEAVGFLFLMTKDANEKSRLVQFLTDFVSCEEGASHIVSDRYAVSLVPAVLAFLISGKTEEAKNLLQLCTIWLCDCYQKGFGLAHIGSSVTEEVVKLLGYPFEALQVEKHPSSFAATVVCDLAALTGDKLLYQNVVNDFKACDIAFSYWQSPDSPGQFLITASDLVYYPNIHYDDDIDAFDSLQFAEHITSEPRTFEQVNQYGPIGHIALSLLLRDRYFPTIWPLLVNGTNNVLLP